MGLRDFPRGHRTSSDPLLSVNPFHFQMERVGNTLRLVQPKVHLPNVARRNLKQTRDSAVQPVVFAVLSDRLTIAALRGNLQLQNLSSVRMDEDYSERRQKVNKKSTNGEIKLVQKQVGERMRETRLRLGLSQEQMAQHFNVTTGAYGKWETGLNSPRGTVFAVLSRLAPDDEKAWWLEQAGLQSESNPKDSDLRSVPFLREALAAGVPRDVSECEKQAPLVLPRAWLPSDGNLVAVCVRGDSMAPIVQEGYVVIIDTLARNPGKLVGRMVAAREGNGVTIKWLRKDGETYLLEAQNISRRHQVRILRPDGDFSIVGAVVKLIADVPKLGQV